MWPSPRLLQLSGPAHTMAASTSKPWPSLGDNFDTKMQFTSPVPRHEAQRVHRHLLRRCPKDMGSFVEITCSRSVGSYAWCVGIPTFFGRSLKISHAPLDMNTRSSKQL